MGQAAACRSLRSLWTFCATRCCCCCFFFRDVEQWARHAIHGFGINFLALALALAQPAPGLANGVSIESLLRHSLFPRRPDPRARVRSAATIAVLVYTHAFVDRTVRRRH